MSFKPRDEVLKVVGNKFISTMEIAQSIGSGNPEILASKYRGSVPFLSRALGNVCTAMVREHLLMDDNTPYPGVKKYKKPEQEQNNDISVEMVAAEYAKNGYVKDEREGILLLAKRALNEHKEEYEGILTEIRNARENMERLKGKIGA